MPEMFVRRSTLDFSTLKKLVSQNNPPREAWIAAIDEVCKYFPENIPRVFTTPLWKIPKITQSFSYSLDMPDGTEELVMAPGMWIELPPKMIETETLYWGLIVNTFGNTHWVLALVTFDDISRSRKPEKLEIQIVNLEELLNRTGISPKSVIDELLCFWSTVEEKIEEMLKDVKSQTDCLDFPALLALLEEIPAE